MIKISISVAVLFLLLGGCDDNNGGQKRGMMGNGGMMGKVEIPGERPPPETNTKYVQGYQQAKITCSQCHAMPHPNQHSSSEWPAVIARMENHITAYNKTMPKGDALESIVSYYVSNSK